VVGVSRKEFRDLAPPARAREVLDGLALRPDPETVALAEARGRVTAQRVDATLDVPGFDRSAMDGYAVRAEDTFGADEADPVELGLVGTVHAGEEPDVTVDPGTAAEISTGAVLPSGADAVVMVERTAERDGGVAVRTAVAPGDNVMVAGADIAAGSRAFGPGTRITSRDVGLLSALGLTDVPVRGQPTVGIVSTGDELVQPGDDLDSDRGQIYDVNSHTVAAAVAEAGGEAVRYPHVGDDYEAMEQTLVTAADECDLVLSSGSTSAGAVDVIYDVIDEQGELLLHGVAVKPGKPMLVGRVGESAYVGLPGYPVSALTIFRTFVAPVVRDAAGLPDPETGTVDGRMAVREQYSEGRLRFMPVGLVTDTAGDVLVYPVDKGSGATTSLVEADGIVEMAPETEYFAAGEDVEVRLFSPDVRPPALFGVGEDDPGLSRLLDRLESARYLPAGSREGRRRMRNGVPDVAVVAGPSDRSVDGERLGSWTRAWGLVVPEGNPAGLEGVGDLVDGDLRFVNRDRDSGLRAALDEAVTSLATESGTGGRPEESGAASRAGGRRDVTASIDGYGLTTNAHESPARRVAAGKADAGLGLCATAAKLDLGFVPLGEQRVEAYANPERTGKPAVRTLGGLLDDAADVFDDLEGYRHR
jgi:putative molybdopterin biosynthesis protein